MVIGAFRPRPRQKKAAARTIEITDAASRLPRQPQIIPGPASTGAASIAIADVVKRAFRCSIPIQRDHLIAGALLADVGKPLEYDKDASGKVVQGKFGQQVRHPFSGVALAYKHGIPGEVMHIIATHSHEGDKMERSIESIIFHHADFVDFDIAKLLGKRAAEK